MIRNRKISDNTNNQRRFLSEMKHNNHTANSDEFDINENVKDYIDTRRDETPIEPCIQNQTLSTTPKPKRNSQVRWVERSNFKKSTTTKFKNSYIEDQKKSRFLIDD